MNFRNKYNDLFLNEKSFRKIYSTRDQNSHKGNFGYVAIIGGCEKYPGAVKLASLSLSALRAGCGVSRLIIPSCIYDSVSPYVITSTLVSFPSENGHMKFDPVIINESLSGINSASIGMGWGLYKENAEILEYILKYYNINIVIDADGLNVLSAYNKVNCLKESKCRIIITPHLKEFERLSGYSIESIKNDPVNCSKEFASKYGITVLLKGHTTIITNGEKLIFSDTGCAGMATAGSGDVLSGIITGILGFYDEDTVLAAACGAYINGLAGEAAERKTNQFSMISLDTALSISEAINKILSE